MIAVGAFAFMALLTTTARGDVGPQAAFTPAVEIRHTTPAPSEAGMETTAAVVTTCRPYMICEPIHVQLTYVFIDSDGVTRFISIGRIVDARGGTVEFAYPAYGTFVRITGSQHWCDRLTRNCGTTPTTSEELPASAP